MKGQLLQTGPAEGFSPPQRLLMGPGPINCDPRVLRAMSQQVIGQFDPDMTRCMSETMQLYRGVFCTQNQWTFLVDSTSRGGIEACLVSLLAPGDKVLVGDFGRFGALLREIAERCGAVVETVAAPWGEVLRPEQVAEAIDRCGPKLLALVQGDTSTTMCQPLAEIGAICREKGVLLYCDATASIAGNTLKVDDWQLDAVSVGLQKCIGGPSGSAPLTLGEAAVAEIRKRHHVEAGIQTAQHVAGEGRRISSNYFDLAMIMDYWGEERLNHHTEAASMLYCARECARILLAEGIDAAVERHRINGAAMAAGLAALNLELYGDQAHRMNNVVGVYIPDGVDGDLLRREMLQCYAIEIGTSFGPLHGVVWRIGVMGYNARPDAVLLTLAALEQCLLRQGHPLSPGAAAAAALACYG